jgi:hypothetical protein
MATIFNDAENASSQNIDLRKASCDQSNIFFHHHALLKKIPFSDCYNGTQSFIHEKCTPFTCSYRSVAVAVNGA